MARRAILSCASFIAFLVIFHNQSGLIPAEAFSRGSQSEAQSKNARPQNDAGDLFNQARDLMRARQFEKAAETYKRIIASQPDSAAAHAGLAMAVLSQDRATEALSIAQRGTQLDPNYAFGYLALANVEHAMNRFDEAIEACKQAIRINPNYMEAYGLLGSLYGQTRRYEQSLEAFTQAQRLNANNADVYNGLGIAYYRLGRHEEGIAAVKEAVRLFPNFANAYINLGNWYNDLGRYEEAADAYSQVIRIVPRFPSGYFNRSLLNMYLGREAMAAEDARTFLSIADWHRERSPYMVLIAALGFRHSDRASEAVEILDLAAKRCNTAEWPYPIIRYLRAELTAQALMDMATDNDRMTEARTYIGMAFLASGQREEGLKHLQWVKQNGNKTFIEYKLALASAGRAVPAKQR